MADAFGLALKQGLLWSHSITNYAYEASIESLPASELPQ